MWQRQRGSRPARVCPRPGRRSAGRAAAPRRPAVTSSAIAGSRLEDALVGLALGLPQRAASPGEPCSRLWMRLVIVKNSGAPSITSQRVSTPALRGRRRARVCSISATPPPCAVELMFHTVRSPSSATAHGGERGAPPPGRGPAGAPASPTARPGRAPPAPRPRALLPVARESATSAGSSPGVRVGRDPVRRVARHDVSAVSCSARPTGCSPGPAHRGEPPPRASTGIIVGAVGDGRCARADNHGRGRLGAGHAGHLLGRRALRCAWSPSASTSTAGPTGATSAWS